MINMHGLTVSGKYGIALRYIGFAGIAGLVNILAQGVTLYVLTLFFRDYQSSYHLTVAMSVGTFAGLLPKYVLDSRWIFPVKTSIATTTRRHTRTLPLYTMTSVITTLIFWIFEYALDLIKGGNWRYLGAVVGLSIGYRVKYLLDQKFVFTIPAT